MPPRIVLFLALVFWEACGETAYKTKLSHIESISSKYQLGSACEIFNCSSFLDYRSNADRFSSMAILWPFPSCRNLYLADSWTNATRKETLRKLAPLRRTKIKRNIKPTFLTITEMYKIPDGSLDLVYMNAADSATAGCEYDTELKALWKKLKHGGVLAGSGYATVDGMCARGIEMQLDCSIYQAVNRFSDNLGLNVYNLTFDKQGPGWVISPKPSVSDDIYSFVPESPVPLVPNIVHLVFIHDGPMYPYSFVNFLAVMHHLKPEAIYVHCYTEPTGPYWKRIKSIAPIKVHTLVGNLSIHGISPKPNDYAHQSDIVRLTALIEHGGIYLDTDVLIMKSLDRFKYNSMTMGQENPWKLGNAVMLAAKNSSFMRKWYEEYRDVNFNCWGCHSLKRPMVLSKKFPKLVNVVPRVSFFKFNSEIYDDSISDDLRVDRVFAVHLERSKMAWTVQNFTEYDICFNLTAYSKLIYTSLSTSRWYAEICHVQPNAQYVGSVSRDLADIKDFSELGALLTKLNFRVALYVKLQNKLELSLLWRKWMNLETAYVVGPMEGTDGNAGQSSGRFNTTFFRNHEALPDLSVDFAHLVRWDNNYCSCMKYLRFAWSKLKNGGILAGRGCVRVDYEAILKPSKSITSSISLFAKQKNSVVYMMKNGHWMIGPKQSMVPVTTL